MLIKLSSIFLHFFSLPIITMYFWRTGKYLKKGVHWSVWESAPSAPPDSFFQQGQKHTISNFRGGILSGGAYAPPLLKQGGHMHTVPHGCARLWKYLLMKFTNCSPKIALYDGWHCHALLLFS